MSAPRSRKRTLTDTEGSEIISDGAVARPSATAGHARVEFTICLRTSALMYCGPACVLPVRSSGSTRRLSDDSGPKAPKRKAVEPCSGRTVALAREDDGSHWVMPEIEEAEAKRRWRKRSRAAWDAEAYQLGVSDSEQKRLEGVALEFKKVPAVAHFKAVKLDEEDDQVLELRLGDFVEVNLGAEDDETEDHFGVMQVVELFEDIQGNRWFDGHWFYRMGETQLAVKGKDLWTTICPKRIFRASEYDNSQGYATTYPFAFINRKVDVRHIVPGSEPLTSVDYWWEQEHDRRFFTFKDLYPSGSARQSRLASRQTKTLRCADFYAGCGGLSFVDRQTDQIHITTSWAIDFCESMTLSFKANYPETEVFKTGVDEFLMLCQMFTVLVLEYCPDMDIDVDTSKLPSLDGPSQDAAATATGKQHKSGKADVAAGKSKQKGKGSPSKVGKGKQKMAKKSLKSPSKRHSVDVESIEGMRLGDTAKRGKSGQKKGCLEEPLSTENSWLEVLVKREDQEAVWEKLHEADLPDSALATFVKATHTSKAIPVPGDIDVVMGGPPCQGVSGLNRHSARQDILEDGRNRQVTAFYDVVEFFKPAYVLMENVVDIFKKEDGMYAKSAMASLLSMRYQVRAGIIAACDHGVPQSRNRVFMWGAKSGEEQLPPFPEPTHRGVRNGLGDKYRHCIVNFISEASRRSAHPVVTMGDILSDLPKVGNLTFAERAQYASEPQTPMQAWLQRPPPAWQASRDSRAGRADAFMQEGHAILEKRYRRHEGKVGGFEQIGGMFSCATTHHTRFAWNRLMSECKDDQERSEIKGAMDASKKALYHHTGTHVLEMLDEAREATGPIRDHRPLCLNLDDHIRVCRVKKAKGHNFRSLPGVVSHPDGTCCAGHWHAQIVDGHSSCPAGGHWLKPKRSLNKESRVDCGYPEDSFPGLQLAGCGAYTVFMPSGGLLCPRWCITYKEGKSCGRHGCYGIVWYDEVQPTVVGRAEPHNLALIHPEQDRVLTIRENARTQGFPDYFALVGIASGHSWVRNKSLTDRYQQMGNAVCPMVASALGRCLALAALGTAPDSLDQAVIPIPDPDFEKTIAESEARGLKYYAEREQVALKACVAGGGDDASDEEDQPEGAEETDT